MKRPNPTQIVAATVLCVAVLGSTPVGQAAARLVVPRNSVGTAQLKQQSVTGLKVKDGTLLATDFKAGQLPAGPQGAQGLPGPAGPRGATGAVGLAKVEQTAGAGQNVNPGATGGGTVTCPAGEIAIGGGFFAETGLYSTVSYWIGADTWYVRMFNGGQSVHTFAPYAICAVVAS